MPQRPDRRKNRKSTWSLISRCMVSLVSVVFTQLGLCMVPLFFPTSSTLVLLSLSALVMVVLLCFVRCCKTLVGVRGSAPAFVFFSIIFTWVVFISIIRHAVSPLLDMGFNLEVALVIIGLFRIMSSDPGFIKKEMSSSQGEPQAEVLELATCTMEDECPEQFIAGGRRARYCKYCKAYVEGFDHHCPAFGNCIGHKNHVLFIGLLICFITSEATYIMCAFQFPSRSLPLEKYGKEAAWRNLVLSSLVFCLFQVTWQVVFLGWHIYCVCFNIRTDEWINWKRYPEFQLNIPLHTGDSQTEVRFINPYNKGIWSNLKEFIRGKG